MVSYLNRKSSAAGTTDWQWVQIALHKLSDYQKAWVYIVEFRCKLDEDLPPAEKSVFMMIAMDGTIYFDLSGSRNHRLNEVIMEFPRVVDGSASARIRSELLNQNVGGIF